MVSVGDLIRFYNADVAVVQEVEEYESSPSHGPHLTGHDPPRYSTYMAIKVIFQDNPHGFCIYNLALDHEGEIYYSERIFGKSKYGDIQSLKAP